MPFIHAALATLVPVMISFLHGLKSANYLSLFFYTAATGEVTLAIHLAEVNSISICTAQVQPVLFVRASETFGWSARDRLGISSTFQQGKNYYNPDSPGMSIYLFVS